MEDKEIVEEIAHVMYRHTHTYDAWDQEEEHVRDSYRIKVVEVLNAVDQAGYSLRFRRGKQR